MLHALLIASTLAIAPPADLDGDCHVGVPDLMLLLSEWGPCEPGNPADLTRSGAVGVPDLLMLISQFGEECRPMSHHPVGLYLTGTPPINIKTAIPDISGDDFSIVGWIRRNPADTTIDQCLALWGNDSPVIRMRNQSSNGTSIVRVGSTNGSTISEISVNDWTLAILTWEQSTQTARVHIANENGSGTSTLVVGENLPEVDEFQAFNADTAGLNNWNGDIGCWAIHPGKLFDLSDAQAMFADRRAMIPLLYDDGLEHESLIAGTYSILQNPSGSGVSPINGARVGSTVANGNYIVSNGGTIYTARPITVTGSPIYTLDDSGFFAPDIAPVTGGVVGNSARIKRWADNEPRGLERISVHGNSRVARQTKHAAVGDQSDWPYGYSGTIQTGLAFQNTSKLAGVGGHRIDLANGSRFAAFDYADAPWTSGQAAAASTSDDACRFWIGSVTTTVPSRPIRLGNNGQISVKFREVPGSLINDEAAMQFRMTYARFPGASNFEYRLVEADAQDEQGDFIGPGLQTDDADTTEFAHTFDDAIDSYNSKTKTLVLRMATAPEVGWLISITSGTGAGGIAQITDVQSSGNARTITLKHAFSTGPADESDLAFGPWSYGSATLQCPTSEKSWRGMWCKGVVNAGELGAYLLSPDIWREGVDGWIVSAFGWGGNGFKPQMDETFDGVPAAMVAQIGVDTALIHDGYQGTTVSTHFPQFAALLEEGGAEAVYLVAQANTVTASQESTYATFALGQSDRAAVVVTDSPLIQSELGQINYSGKHNSAHPSVETWVNVGAALAETAALEWHDVISSSCVSVPNVEGTYLGAIRVTVAEGLTLEHGINGNERYDIKIIEGESTLLQTSFDLGDGTLAEMIAYLQGQLAENEVEGVTLALGDAYEPDTPATVLQEQWSVAEPQPAGTYWLVGDEACTPAGAGVSAIPSELVSGLGLGVIDD